MSTIKLNNIPTMSVGRAVDALADMYGAALLSGIPLHSLPSVMLWGPPGIGKSQAIRQLAEVIGRKTGKRTAITDVRLLLFNPIDLRGIPTANADKTLAIWLKPQIFQMDPDPRIVNFLFLDEISAAPQSVQAAACWCSRMQSWHSSAAKWTPRVTFWWRPSPMRFWSMPSHLFPCPAAPPLAAQPS